MKRLYFLLATIFIAITLLAQKPEDTKDGFFHDDLLNNFIGKWTASGIVHEQKFENINFEGKWILNHQYFQIHEIGNDTVPWLHMKYESLFFIGYDANDKHYVAHLLNVFGAGNPLGYVFFGKRNGNEIKFTSQLADPPSGSYDIESFTWQPETRSWRFVARSLNKGKEEAPYVDLKIEKK